MSVALKSRTLAAAIADRLRQQIVDGTLAAGSQLRQDGLALEFGVSRIPVREALIQLEAEGLVRIEPHRGAVVTALSADEVRDVFELRSLMEPRLLAQSIPRLTAGDLVALDALQSAFAKALNERDANRWGALNAELHMAMYRRAPLPRTLSIVAGLLQTSERYTRLQLSRATTWERAQREHGELIGHCRTGNTAAAAELLVRHIAQVQDDLSAFITRGG